MSPESPDPQTPAISWRIAIALNFFASGAVLVLEIMAGRLLAPYVGISLETFTGVIGTVLAGIAAGSTLGGRYADRHPPARAIGPVLTLGGIFALLSVPIISTLGPGADGSVASIIVLTFAAFFAPAAILASIGPLLAKATLGDLHSTGSVVGNLSAAGTAGALVGTFLTGFVLVAALPTRVIIVALAITLAGLGILMWIRLRDESPGLLVMGAIGLGTILSIVPTNPCAFETEYSCIQIVSDPDRPSGRVLQLDNARHSYVDLEDPTYLDFRYLRLVAAALESLPEGPMDVLHIGGGAFTLPRYLDAVRPGSQHLVLEIDDELVDIVRSEFGLELDSSMAVRTGDARLSLGDIPSQSYDLVMGDAFSGHTVPWHLTTTEVIDELERVLRPDGLYVMNLIDGIASRFSRAELATLGEHFANVAVILPADDRHLSRSSNQLLLASNAPIPHVAPSADGVLLDGPELLDFIGDAAPLNDDFAPVDQLLPSR